MNLISADVAVIGGGGRYSSGGPVGGPGRHSVRSAFGAVALGTVSGRRVAFLPRHGTDHALPPHRINYRANLWALRSLGVRQVLAPCAVGGLRPEVKPGDFVLPDQLVDGPAVGRRAISTRAPCMYRCRPVLRAAGRGCARCRTARAGRRDDGRGGGSTLLDPCRVPALRGPGWSLVNMTGHPEAVLARELRMCYRLSRW